MTRSENVKMELNEIIESMKTDNDEFKKTLNDIKESLTKLTEK